MSIGSGSIDQKLQSSKQNTFMNPSQIDFDFIPIVCIERDALVVRALTIEMLASDRIVRVGLLLVGIHDLLHNALRTTVDSFLLSELVKILEEEPGCTGPEETGQDREA
jgi:hypothetical protein